MGRRGQRGAVGTFGEYKMYKIITQESGPEKGNTASQQPELTNEQTEQQTVD